MALSVRFDAIQFEWSIVHTEGSQVIVSEIGKKTINLTVKLGENNNIEHNKGSKIYPQNQVILDCIMPTIPLLKHKCLSIILCFLFLLLYIPCQQLWSLWDGQFT